MVPVAQAALSGLSHDCSTWDELYEDDDGEHPNEWNAPTSSNAPKPAKKAKTMAAANEPATVLSDVAKCFDPRSRSRASHECECQGEVGSHEPRVN